MDTKYPGQEKATPIGKAPTGMWSDPSVKEGDSETSLAEALRYFIANPDTLGLPTHVSEAEKRVVFDNGKALSFDEVVAAHKNGTTEKDSSFFDGPVDLGKEHDGDFPSVTWMPRGQEDKDVSDTDLTAARGVPGSVFTAETAPAVLEQIKTNVKAPYVNGSVSTLGGAENASILITISLDPKESWANGILENSRYGKFHIENDGVVEMHSGSLRFRKTLAKSVEDLINKLNKGITPTQPQVASSVKTAATLDENLLRQAIEKYVADNKYDIDWFERYGENFVEYLRDSAYEESNKRLSDNVISRILEEMDADQWYDQYAESEVDSWFSTLEGITTEEDLAETYPQILAPYKQLKPNVQMEFKSSLEDFPEEYKQQIAAKYGVEYISGLDHYNDAVKNKHPEDRAIQYAVAELKKQDVTIDPTVLQAVVKTYSK